LHQISNFPLGELTALPHIPSWWGGRLAAPLSKNPTPTLALRPPPRFPLPRFTRHRPAVKQCH